MTGHARSGESGHDLVCAASSILAYTLAKNVAEIKDAGYAYNCAIELKPGDAFIECSPRRKYRSVVTMVFDTVCTGFDLLAQQYPEFISFELMG